jgi:hypothetical protein
MKRAQTAEFKHNIAIKTLSLLTASIALTGSESKAGSLVQLTPAASIVLFYRLRNPLILNQQCLMPGMQKHHRVSK